MIDGDGRTNTIYYATNNPYSTNLISQVTDPFGRSVSLAYDNLGRLTNITDVGGISSSFLYDINNNWVTNLTTPYGATSFAITDTTGTNVAPNGRSVRVTGPDGGAELYLYQDNEPGLTASYPSGVVPNTTPFANMLDNGDCNVRDSFHWGRLQYAALSTTNISLLTSNDFLKAWMKHWLLTRGIYWTGQTLSMERAPSPDSGGTIEGQKTWYDYAGKVATASKARNTCPCWSAASCRTARPPSAAPTAIPSATCSPTPAPGRRAAGGGRAHEHLHLCRQRHGPDHRQKRDGCSGVQQPFQRLSRNLTHYDALNEITSYLYNTNQQVASVTLSHRTGYH